VSQFVTTRSSAKLFLGQLRESRIKVRENREREHELLNRTPILTKPPRPLLQPSRNSRGRRLLCIPPETQFPSPNNLYVVHPPFLLVRHEEVHHIKLNIKIDRVPALAHNTNLRFWRYGCELLNKGDDGGGVCGQAWIIGC
jgi:hypothetical protein